MPSTVAGREVERRALTAFVEDLFAGRSGVLVLRGPAGIGKSALARWASELARGRGATIVQVALPMNAPSGLAVLASRLSERLSVAPRPGSDPTSVVVELSRSFDRLHADAALVVLDDAQALEPDARTALIDVLRLADMPVGLIETRRSTGGEEPALGSHGDVPMRALEVGPMPLADLRVLLEQELGGPVMEGLAETVLDVTAGNPLFALETIRAWKASGSLTTLAGRYGLGSDEGATRSVDEAIAASLARVSAPAIQLLTAVAALDRPSSIVVAGDVARVSGEALVRATDELTRSSMLLSEQRDAGLHVSIAHPRYATVALAKLSDVDRAVLFGRAFDALRGRGDVSPDELAESALRMLQAPTDLDEILTEAARVAEIEGSFARAAGYRRALADRACEGDERARALYALATALRRTEPHAAIAALRDCARLTSDPELRARAQVESIELTVTLDIEGDDPIGAIRAALTDAPNDVALDLELRLAMVQAALGRPEDAHETLRDLAAKGSAKALMSLAAAPYARGEFQEAIVLLEEASARAADRSEHWIVATNLGWTLAFSGRLDAADRIVRQTLDEVRTADAHARACRLVACATTIAAWRGDAARAIELAWTFLPIARVRGGGALEADVAVALAVALHESGAHAEAFDVVSSVSAIDAVPVALALADAAVELGELGVAQSAIDRTAGADGDPLRRVSLARLVGRLHLAENHPAKALEALSGCLSEPSPIVFEQARALELAAEALRRTGRRGRGVEVAREALALYEQLGSEHRATALRSWIESHQRGTRQRRAPGQMTERERQVLELAASGLTNAEIAQRLFLSPATVKKHVENILARTGARRRNELYKYASPRAR